MSNSSDECRSSRVEVTRNFRPPSGLDRLGPVCKRVRPSGRKPYSTVCWRGSRGGPLGCLQEVEGCLDSPSLQPRRRNPATGEGTESYTGKSRTKTIKGETVKETKRRGPGLTSVKSTGSERALHFCRLRVRRRTSDHRFCVSGELWYFRFLEKNKDLI